jgi:hypothetical protein
MLFVWSGWGVLTPVVLVAGFLLGLFTAAGLGANPVVNAALMLAGVLLACVGLWFLGNRLNRPYPGYDRTTGEPVMYRNGHTFFWVPMQYWAFIGAAAAVGLGIAGLA